MKDNIAESLQLLEMLKKGVGKVRTEKEVQDDLDREFQERLKQEQEQAEQERLFRERMEQERKERQEMNYMAHKEIFDFMKVFNELPVDDYYAIVELINGKQYYAKPGELKRDTEYIMLFIERNVGANSLFENPYQEILQTNVNEIKGIKLVPEEQKEIVIIKKTKFGVWEE